MRSHPFDKDNLPLVVDRRHQPIVVAFDIEHDPVAANDAGCTVVAFHISRTVPLGSLRLIETRVERSLHGFGSPRRRDKSQKRPTRYHPHADPIT